MFQVKKETLSTYPAIKACSLHSSEFSFCWSSLASCSLITSSKLHGVVWTGLDQGEGFPQGFAGFCVEVGVSDKVPSISISLLVFVCAEEFMVDNIFVVWVL